MPWLKAGDNAATYPRVLAAAALAGADTRTVNELFGFMMRCALQSAGHMTDYLVDEGTAWMLGGAETERLLALAKKTGLMRPERKDGLRVWRLLDDPDFVHIRLRAEVAWEQQQRTDTADVRLAVPVRLRDGDCCRYCNVVVQWRGRTSNRKGTLDHLNPGEAATVETMVVACMACNSALRDEKGQAREALRPPPERPHYSKFTAEYLTKHGHPTVPTEDLQRPGAQPDHAPTPGSDPAASRATRPAPTTAPLPVGNLPAGMAAESGLNGLQVPTESSSAGSGRDGHRSGVPGPSQPPPQPPSRSRRGKRSARGRPRTGGAR